MPSLLKLVAMAATCLVMISGSAIPLNTSPASELLDKRADLQTCPGIDNKLVRAQRFRVRCDTDTLYSGGREVAEQAEDFDDCMGKCEGAKYNYRDWCKFASFPGKINERGACYLKAGNGWGKGDSGSANYKTSKGIKLAIRR